MFESDDYDQVLSQIVFPEVLEAKNTKSKELSQYDLTNKLKNNERDTTISTTTNKNLASNLQRKIETGEKPTLFQTNVDPVISPKHTKRKIINAHFDHANKRKFPGPAGLLTGTLEETKENSLCQIELLSQDIDSSQTHLQQGLFETPLWKRLLDDTKTLVNINTIKSIKQQALAGNLRQKKADIVRGHVDCIDRSAIDPLITLRDTTGHIQCTLHRDAWTHFATYIASEYCALVLQKTTVLTTGSAFKKHYLNITPSNIFFIYSSTIMGDDEELPDGFVKICHEDFTIVKREKQIESLDSISNFEDNEADTLEGLDFSEFF